ncbi:hypothetical protein MZM54_00640 [[Brevibacterium] frigoritolerans]|nr:hypothetical protein [Peribacillus frigoritolerans]
MKKTKEIIELLKLNPDCELIFMYPEEGSDYAYTLGYPDKIMVDEYVTIDDRVWIKEHDIDGLRKKLGEEIFYSLYKDGTSLTEAQETEIEEKVEKEIAEMQWEKAIVVFIRG